MKNQPLWLKIGAGLLLLALLAVLFWPAPAPKRGLLTKKQVRDQQAQVQALMADTAAMAQRVRELEAATARAAAQSRAAGKTVNHTIIQHNAENEAYTRLPASSRHAADVRTILEAEPTVSKYGHLPIVED